MNRLLVVALIGVALLNYVPPLFAKVVEEGNWKYSKIKDELTGEVLSESVSVTSSFGRFGQAVLFYYCGHKAGKDGDFVFFSKHGFKPGVGSKLDQLGIRWVTMSKEGEAWWGKKDGVVVPSDSLWGTLKGNRKFLSVNLPGVLLNELHYPGEPSDPWKPAVLKVELFPAANMGVGKVVIFPLEGYREALNSCPKGMNQHR